MHFRSARRRRSRIPARAAGGIAVCIASRRCEQFGRRGGARRSRRRCRQHGGQRGPDGVGESLEAFRRADRGDHVGAAWFCGAIAGWTNRSPDVMAVPRDASVSIPVLWVDAALECRSTGKASAEEQLHYALFEAPHDERVAAFLAVPGFFPHSHDQVSQGLYPARADLVSRMQHRGARALESELSAWKSAKTHEQELVSVVRIAVKLRKSRLGRRARRVQGNHARRASDMYDPALVELASRDLHRRPGGCDPVGDRVDSIRESTCSRCSRNLVLAALPDRGAQGQSRAVAGRSRSVIESTKRVGSRGAWHS